MAGNNFDFTELKQFRDNLVKVEKSIPKFLEMFILKMAYRTLRATKRITPVDTGELRNKWEVTDVKLHKYYVSASIVNSQEYASFVEDGHWQRRRWLPGRWVGNKFQYVPHSSYGPNLESGIMLQEKWIPGHYMARISLNKVQNELPRRFEHEFKRWMQQELGVGL